jgi:hypothetical protein
MSKVLYIFCEGHTEKAVLGRFLHHYWSFRFSACEVRRYDGNGDLRTKFALEAIMELKAEPNSSVLCLVDLYEEPFEVYDKNRMTHEEGFEAVRNQLLGQIDIKYHDRFGAFPVVMELETWILADPQFQSRIGNNYLTPESIEHPAQELERWKSNYNKKIDGVDLFNRASAKRVYADNCPHFKLMIEWLIAEPKAPDPEVLEKLNSWQEHQNLLMDKIGEALQKSEQALFQDDLDKAIEWDEIYKQLAKELQEHANVRDRIFKEQNQS